MVNQFEIVETTNIKNLETISQWFQKDNEGLRWIQFYQHPKPWHKLLNKRRKVPIFLINGNPAGFIDLEGSPNNKTATIAYYLNPQNRGQGLAPKMLNLSLNWIKTKTEYKIVKAHVDPANTPSIKTLTKTGFNYHPEPQKEEPEYLTYQISLQN